MALTFRYPDEELACALLSGEWAAAASEIALALGLPLGEGWDAGLPGASRAAAGGLASDAGSDALLRALRAEATRLFVGAPDPAVSPYEGVWRAADDGVQPLLFVNPHSMAVGRFVRACGLGWPKGVNEPLDHVAVECELMERLAWQAAASIARAADAHAAEAGSPADSPFVSEGSAGPALPVPSDVEERPFDGRSFPGGSPSAAYARFAAEHIGVWMPRFAAAVEVEARQPAFGAAARFMGALTKAAL